MKTRRMVAYKRLLLLALGTLSFSWCLPQNLDRQLPWVLMWYDDFDHAPLDQNKWCRIDWRGYSFNRHDLQAFRTDPTNPPDNLEWQSSNSSGLTYVTQVVKKEQRTRFVDDIETAGIYDPELHTYEYSAPGFMTSKSKFKYGYFELRAKLPVLNPGENNLGFGANFWMYKESPTPTGNPKSEIDIFEFLSQPYPHALSTNAHHRVDWYDYGFHAYTYARPAPDFNDFHTFGAWWGPDFIKYYVDGVCYREAWDSIRMIASEMIPMQIIIDINVFTGGEVPLLTTVVPPYRYDIDYVKVYQINADQCTTDYINCSPLPALPSVYRKMTIGGGGCVFPSGSVKGLTSRTDITILPGFEAALGSELVLDIYPYCHSSEMTNCQSCTQCD